MISRCESLFTKKKTGVNIRIKDFWYTKLIICFRFKLFKAKQMRNRIVKAALNKKVKDLRKAGKLDSYAPVAVK